MSDVTSSYVISQICKDYQENVAVSSKLKEDEIEWSVKAEILFLYALMGRKPVGINRHFMMLFIHKKFSSYINREISTKPLWNHLDSMYNMATLHDSEVCPFPNEEIDFELPEDCFDLLEKKYGVRLEKDYDENESNKKNSKPKSKLKQSIISKSNLGSPKNLVVVMNDATPKVKQELGVSSKTSKVKHSSRHLSSKLKSELPVTASENSLVTSSRKKSIKLGDKHKSENPIVNNDSNISSDRKVKIEQDGSNVKGKKTVKNPVETNISAKKNSKCEHGDNSRSDRVETSNTAKKNIKDKGLLDSNKKGKITEKPTKTVETSTRKSKVSRNIAKKYEYKNPLKKASKVLSTKQVKTEVKSLSNSNKRGDAEAAPSARSKKTSSEVKVKDSAKKIKHSRVEKPIRKTSTRRHQ